MRDNQQILKFMSSRPLMVLSSLNEVHEPESAVVGFAPTENFELIFGTSNETRKAKNILQNEKVSAVIGWDSEGTVQYEGKARMLAGAEADQYAELYFQNNPYARRKYKDDPKEIYILIEPAWLRFTEVKHDPWKITEIKF